MRWDRGRREAAAFGIAVLLGMGLARCGARNPPPHIILTHPLGNGLGAQASQPCQPSNPDCLCNTAVDGTTTCVLANCPAAQACGNVCCPAGDLCDQNACAPATNAQCTWEPGPNDFDAPSVAWWWPYTDTTGSTYQDIDMPGYYQVMSTPVVVKPPDAAPDDPPTVYFNTFAEGATGNVEGVLRAVRGDNGLPIFTVTDPDLRTDGVSSIAVGDLLGDGHVEIVTGAFDPNGPLSYDGGLIAFREDGTLFWRTPPLYVGWGGPAIADLDGDGKPEVVIGNTVLDGATGEQLCNGSWGGIGDNDTGPLSVLGDIDGDGLPEILSGDMAYKLVKDSTGAYQCEWLWPQVIKDSGGNQLIQGFTAVAQIYNDPAMPTTVGHPDVVVVSRGTVRVQDWTGALLMQPVPLPGGGNGGPPTIADFDGDGQPEIGVAGASHYTVFKPGAPGGVLWTVHSQDVSSSVTGSSVFDFLGNGHPEAIYNDECYMRVYDGATGNIDFEAPNSSCTAYEMPVVADVDGTGAAEILTASNNMCDIRCPYGTQAEAGMHGLRMFTSPSDSWVATRPVWNEHSYHLTNVEDDGEIPTMEPRFWGPGTLNAFRQNYQGAGEFAAPDFVVTQAWVDGTECPDSLMLNAVVANVGSRGVRTGLPVAFYLETPSGNEILGVATVNQQLLPGQSAQVSLAWHGPPVLTPATVFVTADDDGTGTGVHHECNTSNNSFTLGEVICRNAG